MMRIAIVLSSAIARALDRENQVSAHLAHDLHLFADNETQFRQMLANLVAAADPFDNVHVSYLSHRQRHFRIHLRLDLPNLRGKNSG